MAHNNSINWIGGPEQELNISVERLLKYFIKPSSMLHAFDEMLSAKDKELVKSTTDVKGDLTGVDTFFEILNRKTLGAQKHWREPLLNILNSSDLNLRHVVQLAEEDKQYIKDLWSKDRLRKQRCLDTDSLSTPSSIYINHNIRMKNRVSTVFSKLEPNNIIPLFKYYNDYILTQRDIENVNAEIDRKGPIKGAELLLERLVLYEHWFRVLLDVLRHQDVMCETQANLLEEITADLINQFHEEMKTLKDYTEIPGYIVACLSQSRVAFVATAHGSQRLTQTMTVARFEEHTTAFSISRDNQRPSRSLQTNNEVDTPEYETDGGDFSSVNTQTVNIIPAHRPQPNPQPIHPNGDREKTELMVAAETGQCGRVVSLLDRGDSVHVLDGKGRSALMYAADSGCIRCVQHLAASSNVNLEDANGCTALMLAAYQGHVDCVQSLISLSSINKQDNDGCTALFHAARGVGRNFECMQVLLEAGADPDLTNSSGKTALMVAASSESPDCVRLLLDTAKLIDNVDHDGDTALIAASRFGSTECVKILLQHLPGQQYINKQNKRSFTALMMAAENGYFETLQLLINANCDVTERDENGQNALMKAAMKGHRKSVDLLCHTDIDVNKTDLNERSAVIFAAAKGQIKCLLLLAENGANLDQPDKFGYTALMFAACYNQLECVKFLIEREVDVNALSNQNKTALQMAEEKKHLKIVEFLKNISRQ